MTKEEAKWHETLGNMVALAEWLDEEGYFNSTADVVYYFSKPWKWDREWSLYQFWAKTDIEWIRVRCIEAVSENKTWADDVSAEFEEETDK